VWPIVRQPISVQSCTHATLCLEWRRAGNEIHPIYNDCFQM
jgi:hypothetical protein